MLAQRARESKDHAAARAGTSVSVVAVPARSEHRAGVIIEDPVVNVITVDLTLAITGLKVDQHRAEFSEVAVAAQALDISS